MNKLIVAFVGLLLIAIVLGIAISLLFVGNTNEEYLGRIRAFVHLAGAVLFALVAFVGLAYYLKRLLGIQIDDPQLQGEFKIEKLGLEWKQSPTGLTILLTGALILYILLSNPISIKTESKTTTEKDGAKVTHASSTVRAGQTDHLRSFLQKLETLQNDPYTTWRDTLGPVWAAEEAEVRKEALALPEGDTKRRVLTLLNTLPWALKENEIPRNLGRQAANLETQLPPQ